LAKNWQKCWQKLAKNSKTLAKDWQNMAKYGKIWQKFGKKLRKTIRFSLGVELHFR
jgi:hypothetical protein